MLIKKFYRSPAGEGGGGAGGDTSANEGATDGATQNGGDSANTQSTHSSAGDTNESEPEFIRNPAAYWKAEAEKYERLHKNVTDHATSIEARLKTLGGEVEKSTKDDLTKLKEELAAERAEIAKTRLELDQRKAAAEAGIPATLAGRLAGETYDELLADAKALAEIVPAGRNGGSGSSSAGKDGAPASGSTLTLDMIRKMTPQQIRERQSEVDAVLAGK